MKIVYLINSLKNPGGMERVLVNKANYFSEVLGYDIYIVTTDQNKENFFYKLNSKVKCIDLEVDYFKDFTKSFFKRIKPYIDKNKIHKQKIHEILFKLNPDFTISLGCEDTYFLPYMKDNSIKIREFHFGKNFRKDYVKSFKKGFLYKIKAVLETYYEMSICKKYDKVILLTKEDLAEWNNTVKIEVIPNSIIIDKSIKSTCENKKVISVGRLDGQKGYDRLVSAWEIVSNKNKEWVLEIFGEGIDREKLENKIKRKKLDKNIFLMGSTNKIIEKYKESSIYVMSSRYEGFGMVLIEAMSYGLPVISFDCKSGPRDIITNNEDGYLIENGNINELGNKILELIEDTKKRKLFGKYAKENVEKFSENIIMEKWRKLFENF